MSKGVLMTIGHSNLSIESFLRALVENGCELLVDIRRYPGSRRHPQFGQELLFASLESHGINTAWREGLGGRRKPHLDSPNGGLRNLSFRGYADYMQGPEFACEREWLLRHVSEASVAVMCAEAVPWSCHRFLVSDAMLARECRVEHIFVGNDGTSTRKPHDLPSYARVEAGNVWYPGPAQTPSLFQNGIE